MAELHDLLGQVQQAPSVVAGEVAIAGDAHVQPTRGSVGAVRWGT
ncbi:hypothetical protein [Streptomyces melanogenes]